MLFPKRILTAFAALALLAPLAFAQPPGVGGPAKVVVATGRVGTIAPEAEFTGTVFYRKISEVASELRGKVREIHIEVGQDIVKGAPLASIDTVLMEKDLTAAKARLEQVESNIEDAETRFGRADKLAREGLAPQEQFDTYRYDVKALEHQRVAIQAEYERLEALLQKTTVYSPFDGVVLARPVDVGEWLAEGDSVATVAGRGVYDVIADIPEDAARVVKPDDTVSVFVQGLELKGSVVTVVPRADIASRTLPVKIRVEHDQPLYEGMRARARLPIDTPRECLLVPRDAILNELGRTSLFTVNDGIARKHAVEIVAYRGEWAGVDSAVLAPGDAFIVKGHERLRDGMPVDVVPAPDVSSRVHTDD